MKIINKINKLFIITLALLFAGGAQAQWQPDRNVALIVPSTAGGSLDHVGRTIQRAWEQQKLVPTLHVPQRHATVSFQNLRRNLKKKC